MADDGQRQRFRRLNFSTKALSRQAKRAEGATVRHARRFIFQRLENLREARRHIIGWLILLCLLIVAVGAQVAWFMQNYQTTAATSGGTYAEGTVGKIDTLDPLYATSASETAAASLIFSSLYSYDQTGTLRNDLAQSMKIDESHRVYTIALKPDVRWHDGTRLTAEDVVFTVNLIKNPEARSVLQINWRDVTVKALDTTHVQFTLPAVYAAFPHALTFSVLPQHILGDVAPSQIRESNFSRSPIGSGPFRFDQLQRAADGSRIVQMEAFDQYFGGAPRLRHFELHSYDGADQLTGALRTGAVSAAVGTAKDDIASLPTKNFVNLKLPIDSGVYALFNVTGAFTKDVKVREALRLGTDVEALRTQAADGAPALDIPILRSQMAGGVTLPTAPTYNPKQAAALLDQAGWVLQDGFRRKDDQVLTLAVVTVKNPQYERVLELLAGQWRALGVRVNTTVYDPSNPGVSFVGDVLQRRNYDVLLYELSIGADPDVYAYWHSSQVGQSGYNFSNYTNGVSDDALASARLTLDPTLRSLKYKTFVSQWLADVPAIGLYQQEVNYTENRQVNSVDPSTHFVTPLSRYANVLYWSVDTRSVYKTP